LTDQVPSNGLAARAAKAVAPTISAAKNVVRVFLPRDMENLLKIPGVG
jgi:endonuclease III